MLNLQAELDSINQHLVAVQKAIAEDTSNKEAKHFLDSLRRTHERAVIKVEELYAALNVTDSFPEVKGLPFEFMRTLLMARDLKINIRKRAIGTFFEWERLDRAAGGRDEPLGKMRARYLSSTNQYVLGTKLHQQTRSAISKRTPALLTAIRKFNKYCVELQRLYQPEWSFHLPAALPVELGPLREDSSLLADVWVTRVSQPTPRWLCDVLVRKGIQAVLAKDRCLEERRRLEMEADNLCRSYGRDLAAVELAMRNPDSQSAWTALDPYY